MRPLLPGRRPYSRGYLYDPCENNMFINSSATFINLPGENHRSATSYWQILSHNVVLGTPRRERYSISQR